MGRWGAGNFDDDTASDHLSGIAGELVRDVERAMTGDPEELEPDEYWGVAVPCNLELLYLMKQQRYVGVTLPPADTLRAWKRTYLSAWDAGIDELEPTPEHRAARRAVLVTTFDRLIDLSASDGG